MYELPNDVKVSSINAASGRVQREGSRGNQRPSGSGWRTARAFLTDMVNGDEAMHLETANDELQAALIFMQLANAAAQQARQR